MDELQYEATLRAVAGVLERQAFLFAEPLPAGAFRSNGKEYLAATLVFEGPVRGGMLAAFPESLAREMAANLLGAEPDQDRAAEFAADALGEFLNVACGHLLTALFGTGHAFDLTAPLTFGFPSEVAELLSRKCDVLAFEVEGAPLLFQASFCGSLAPHGSAHA